DAAVFGLVGDGAGLDVGDSIRVAARGGSAELTVSGLVVPTSRAPYPLWDHARVFVSEDQLQTLAGGEAAYWAGGFALEDPDSAPEFVSKALRLPGEANARSWQVIRDSIVDENDATYIILGVFATFALGASAFIIASAVAGQIQVQERDIGLLKAVGMTPGWIALLLVAELIVVAVLASGGGVLVAWVLAPRMLGNVDRWLGSSATVAPDPLHAVAILVGAAALAAFVAAVPAIRAGRRGTVESIRSGPAARRTGLSRSARLAARLRLPQPVVIGAKDLFGRRLQAWLTTSAVAVAAAAIFASITAETTLRNALDEPEMLGLKPFDLQVQPLANPSESGSSEDLPSMSSADMEALVSAHPAVERSASLAWQWVSIDGTRYGTYSMGGDYRDFPFVITDGRLMEPGGDPEIEAMIGLGLARKLGLEVGDSSSFVLESERRILYRFKVVGIYIEGDNDGLMLAFDLQDMQAIAPALEPFGYGLALSEGADKQVVAAELINASDGRVIVKDPLIEAENDVERIQDAGRPIMFTLTVFLIVMVSINLFSTLILSVRERTREFGLLKAVGFTPTNVVASVVSNALVLAIIGAVIGAPVGWWFTRWVFDKSASEQGYDAAPVVTNPTLVWVLILLGITLLVTLLGSFLPARHAARLKVSDALRYE
ncbi:MAG: ABC transporter permease, partial [Dehalococcoidia bacterium]